MSDDHGSKDTSEYSSSEAAPQTREYAEEHELEPDDRLEPGGRRGTSQPAGMPALDKDKVT